MSISTFTGIQTSLRGLLAQQRALDVTSHNISNASTVGYTRQEATLAASAPLPVYTSGGATAGALGTGVDVQSYRRVHEQYLDRQYHGQSMSLGDQSARSDALSQVELSFAEPGDNGIASSLEKFWGAWGDVTNGPEGAAPRPAPGPPPPASRSSTRRATWRSGSTTSSRASPARASARRTSTRR